MTKELGPDEMETLMSAITPASMASFKLRAAPEIKVLLKTSTDEVGRLVMAMHFPLPPEAVGALSGRDFSGDKAAIEITAFCRNFVNAVESRRR